jgi:UDP-2-acetamido-3-amino-2,3-dideoxy-glucuronate N-acetyltransferase
MDDIFVETSKCVTDTRGKLYPIEFGELPFKPKRMFLVYDVPAGITRGEHAHHITKQLLYCVKGEIKVTLETVKDDPVSHILTQGDFIFVDKMVWDSQTFLTGDDVLMVIASTEYNKDDYIVDKREFKQKYRDNA